jgi:cytoskeletal protein CcmA (bactofilin family)
VKTRRSFFVLLVIAALFLSAFVPLAAQRFDWVIIKKLTVLEGGAIFNSDVTVDGTLTATDFSAGDDLTVTDDLAVGGDLDVDGATTLNSTLDVDGNISSGTGAITMTDAVNIGVDGTSYDVTFYSDTEGDYFLWDQANVALTLIGTNGQDALNVDDGNVDIADDLDVDGTTNLDDVDIDLSASLNIDGHMLDVGTGSYTHADGDNDLGVAGDAEIDGGIYGDGALDIAGNSQMTGTLNVDGAVTLNSTLDVDGNLASGTGALTVTDNVLIDGQADAEQLVIQGNATQTSNPFVLEQSDGTDVITATNAGALYLASLLDVDGAVAFNSTLDVNGGLTDIGGGSYSTANGDNDLGIAGDLEVDGSTDLDGALGIAGATTAASDITVSSDATGGDAGARSQFIGMPAVKLAALGDLTNGSTESANYIDDDATGECTEVDAGTNLAVTDDATTYRVDTHALRLTFTDVVTDDGVSCNAGAQDDLSSDDSIGFWIYSDVAITSGDFNLVVDDSDGTDQTYDIGAVSAGVWTWKEMDISGCNGNCDTMDNINIIATSQGGTNLTAANVYLDGMWKWAIADEEALGVNLVQDGVLSVIALPTAAGTDNDMAALVEQTDYIVNYQSGNDVIVTVTDQSANGAIALVAYQ